MHRSCCCRFILLVFTYMHHKCVADGQICIGLQGRGHLSCQSRKSQETLEWISSYAANFADSMPDSGSLHLPSCLTQRAVYNMCRESLESQGLEAVSQSHFYKLWANHLSNITIPKVGIILALSFKNDIRNNTLCFLNIS